MKLTVLGKYSPFAPANGAGPGYWVDPDDGGPGLLLDCGPGVLARFQEHVGKPSKIEAVVLSHLHFDHMSDVLVLRYAAAADKRYKELPHHVRVFAPPEPESEFGFLTYKEATSGHPISSDLVLQLGEMRVSFYPGVHAVPSFAVRVEGPGGVFAYSGDSRPCAGLAEAARGADLFLCEASGIEADAEYVAPGHLTARQAGEVAAAAGAKRLLLTHIWPLYDESQLLKECRTAFSESDLVQEGRTYRV